MLETIYKIANNVKH